MMIDPIDRDHLKEMTGGDDEFALELIQEFIRATDALIVNLRDGLRTSDSDAVRIAAHQIKGSALSVGAMLIGDAARVMEDGATNGDLAGLESELDRLVLSFEDLREIQS